jgi:predicted acetyltransferase
LDVRRVSGAELPAWVEANRTGFHQHAREGEVAARRQSVDLGRTWAAFDGDRIVGTLRSFATELTVPGGDALPAAALTNVSVAPTHRRRGLLTRMLTADLAAAAGRGEALGILIASEYPIYGRYGYGPAADEVTYTIDARHATLAVPAGDDATGLRVELADPKAARDEAAAVYDRARLRQPGAIARDELWWDRMAGLAPRPGHEDEEPAFWALARDRASAVTGYVLYRVEQVWEERLLPRGALEVIDLTALDPETTARLWRYCLEADLISTVRAYRGPDDPLRWLLADARDVRRSAHVDHLWVRVLDTPRALAARRYLASGRVVLQVEDPLGHAAGVFALEGGPDGAACVPTREEPELTLPVGALGSAYLGGVSLLLLATAGQVTERRAGALATADAMFRSPVTPWCSTWF